MGERLSLFPLSLHARALVAAQELREKGLLLRHGEDWFLPKPGAWDRVALVLQSYGIWPHPEERDGVVLLQARPERWFPPLSLGGFVFALDERGRLRVQREGPQPAPATSYEFLPRSDPLFPIPLAARQALFRGFVRPWVLEAGPDWVRPRKGYWGDVADAAGWFGLGVRPGSAKGRLCLRLVEPAEGTGLRWQEGEAVGEVEDWGALRVRLGRAERYYSTLPSRRALESLRREDERLRELERLEAVWEKFRTRSPIPEMVALASARSESTRLALLRVVIPWLLRHPEALAAALA